MGNIMESQKHASKYHLLAIGLGLIAVIVISFTIYAFLTKKSPHDQQKGQGSTAVNDVVGQGELQGNEQRDKGKIENECYTFEVPRSISLGMNQYCAVDLGYGSSEGGALVVAPHAMAYSGESVINFDKSLEAYRKQLQTEGVTIASEVAIKLGGQEAVRLTTVKGADKKIIILAKTNTSTRFDSVGQPIQGILISTPNMSRENIEVIDGAVKTWQWRQ